MTKLSLKVLLPPLLLMTTVVLLPAQVNNPSFEKDKISSDSKVVQQLSGWQITKGNVEIVSRNKFAASDGGQSLDLNGDRPGGIKQTIKGLKKNTDYTLKFEYADQPDRQRTDSHILATAMLRINNKEVGTLRNLSKAPNYIGGIGFGFRSTSKGTASIEFVSTTPGDKGLVIDNPRLEEGMPQAPPRNDHLVNGSFELKVASEDKNPHLFGDQLPGWLIMKENIDLIAIRKFGTPDGKWVIDLGGHGPGGIAQTVYGLTPGATYRLSMLYSRHMYWDQRDTLTASVFIDDEEVLTVGRNKLMKAPRWEKLTHEFSAPQDGEIMLSLYSTSYALGGGVLFDHIQLEKVEEVPPVQKIPVLIVDGFSNHNWPPNTQYLTQILENTGKFQVEVSTCPIPSVDKTAWENWKPDFGKYGVVIQTCNNIFKEDSLQWPSPTKKLFEEYVANGGGVYIYHGANNAFKNWEAYNQMIGLGWRNKDFGLALTIDEQEKVRTVPKGEGEKTGHGKRRAVVLTRMNDHPIHRGMPKSWMAADLEVYRYTRGPAQNIDILSYAQDEKTGLNFPMEWVVTFGQGKIYCSTYGHLWRNQTWPPSMRCAAFQQSMVRALQWLSGNPVDNYIEADFPTHKAVVLRKPF